MGYSFEWGRREVAAGRARAPARSLLVLCCALLPIGACSSEEPIAPAPDGRLSVGTWGGEDVAMILADSTAHIHVGCTNGNFPAPITLDQARRFSVSGSYVLRAYPIQIGPSLPAQLAGVINGNTLTFTVAVNDTVQKKLVVLGPVDVEFRRDPRMGPCPICATKAAAQR